MEQVENKSKNKITFLIFGILMIVLLLSGSTYAYWSWQNDESNNTLVTFTLGEEFSCSADGGGNITSNDVQLAPATCTDTTHAIQRKISVNTTISNDAVVSMNLWLKVNSIGTGLSSSHNFRYVLSGNSTSCSGTNVISSGNFYGVSNGNQINILENVDDNTINRAYYLYIWLDEGESDTTTMEENFDFELGGECVDNPPDKFYAVYSETDSSLRFFNDDDAIVVGNTITTGEGNQIVATEVYPLYDNKLYYYGGQSPWFSYVDNIVKVVVEDEISPKHINQWFSNLKNVSLIDLDKLNVSNVTNMSSVFYETGLNVTGDFEIIGLTDWNVSNVTNMDNMFYKVARNASSCNIGDLSNWNTSNVITMYGTFWNFCYSSTSDFDIGNLSSWSTSNVINMGRMFRVAGFMASTWDIGNLSGWDVSKVTDMEYMFYQYGESGTDYNALGNQATIWNVGNLSGWNTSNVIDMHYMFRGAGYNASEFNIGNIGNWNTSKVIDMSYMFERAGNYSSSWNVGDLSNWNVSNVTNMARMFNQIGHNTTSFNLGNLGNWDVSNVTDMNYMFSNSGYNATSWNVGDLSNWDVSSVTKMNYMFNISGYNATSFNLGDLSNWDVSKVTDMRYMFYYTARVATNFTLGDISSWDVSNVTNMNYMLRGMFGSSNYTLDLRNWNVSKVSSYTNFNYGVTDKITAPVWVN